jgi:uncharacterized protein (DUF1499 family)
MRTTKAGRWLSIFFIASWIVVVAAVAGVHWQILPLNLGLMLVALAALVLLAYAVVLLPVVCYKLLLRKPLSQAMLWRCVLGLLPLAILLLTVGVSGLRAPAIHDITTDTENPPRFELAARDRGEGDHPVDYEGEIIARLQHEAYPDIAPLGLAADSVTVVETVRQLVSAHGWRLLGGEDYGSDGYIVEAVAKSLILGFEDDIAIRVMPLPMGGSRVDIRSASRVGLGDLGANAKRIRLFQKTLLERHPQKNL